MSIVGIAGLGAVGERIVRQLSASDDVTELVVDDPDRWRVDAVVAASGGRARAATGPLSRTELDVAVLAGPSGTQLSSLVEHVRAGHRVVTTTDDRDDVETILALDPLARGHDVIVAMGAGFAPGLTCLLAKLASAAMDTVDEIHVFKVGTGGPSCARQHHRALGGRALDWRDQRWIERAGGSGRELCWFPGSVGPLDCYRAELADPLLVVRAFPTAVRVTARMAATRRDRLTARLPMLRPPHREGRVGAVRVDVRGDRHGERVTAVLGATDRPAAAAGAVAAAVALRLAIRRSASGPLLPPGCHGLASVADPVPLLQEVARRGVTIAQFGGTAALSW